MVSASPSPPTAPQGSARRSASQAPLRKCAQQSGGRRCSACRPPAPRAGRPALGQACAPAPEPSHAAMSRRQRARGSARPAVKRRVSGACQVPQQRRPAPAQDAPADLPHQTEPRAPPPAPKHAPPRPPTVWTRPAATGAAAEAGAGASQAPVPALTGAWPGLPAPLTRRGRAVPPMPPGAASPLAPLPPQFVLQHLAPWPPAGAGHACAGVLNGGGGAPAGRAPAGAPALPQPDC